MTKQAKDAVSAVCFCTQASEDAGMRRSRSAWANPVQEDAVISKIRLGVAEAAQA